MKNNFVAFLTYVPFLITSSILLHWIAVAYQIQAYPTFGESTPTEFFGAWHEGNVISVFFVLPAVAMVFLALWKYTSSTQKFVFSIPILLLGLAALTDFWDIYTWWMG
jgi:hypothetical protein